MTQNIVKNVSLPEEEPCQGEAGLCHEGQLQVRKNLSPYQSLNLQVCSFFILTYVMFLARVRMDCLCVCSMCASSLSMPPIYKHNVCINI